MQRLLAAIRSAAPANVWSRGVELSRTQAVVLATGSSLGGDEIELQVRPALQTVTALVTLWPDDEEWSCDCSSPADACVHAAAAAIALGQARAGRIDLGRAEQAAAYVAYRFTRTRGGLALTRCIVAANNEVPLAVPLAVRLRAPGPLVVTQASDSTVDSLLHGRLQTDETPLGRSLLRRCLAALTDAPHVTLDGTPVTVGEAKAPVGLSLSQRPGGAILVRLAQAHGLQETFANGAGRFGNVLCPLSDEGPTVRERQAWERGEVVAPERVPLLLGEVLPAVARRLPIAYNDVSAPRADPQLRCQVVVTLGLVAPSAAQLSPQQPPPVPALSAVPSLVYGWPPQARVVGDVLHLVGHSLPRRNKTHEQQWIERLSEVAMQAGQKQTYSGDAAVSWLGHLGRWAQVHNAQIEDPHNAMRHFTLAPALSPELGANGAQDIWPNFVCRGAKGQLIGRASAEAVIQAWRDNVAVVSLLEGGFAPLPRAWLDRHGDAVRVLLEARAVASSGPLASRGPSAPLPPWALPALHEVAQALGAKVPQQPHGLAADLGPAPALAAHVVLRPYQTQGVAWLRARQEAGVGALLADDMGLGKTLQTLASLSGRALVVAPTSVIFNWAEEAAKFRPDLRLNTFHGTGRKLDPQVDITLTSYGVLRIDAAQLAEIAWDWLVLDEAQTIKNPESQITQAAYAVPARAKIALSGTPVENRLDELWSLMHFCNPGLLGERRNFTSTWAIPIVSDDPTQAQSLRRRLSPFILRRTKKEVMAELPARTEVVLRCQLTAEERAAYNAVHAATQKDVVAQLESGGSVLRALEALLRLRQAACHRGLLPGHEAHTSSKIDLLRETLQEAVAEGHRALVFSQWTGLLDRIEPHLSAANIGYLRLDGSTPDRGAVVRAFSAEAGPPVLLASLKAGGVGLNLTAADHVFLVDPWWNPAAEDQAADRAHRMGQTRPVQIHRLVAIDTVEEKILALQAHKRRLAEAVLSGEATGSSLSRSDLMNLLD